MGRRQRRDFPSKAADHANPGGQVQCGKGRASAVCSGCAQILSDQLVFMHKVQSCHLRLQGREEMYDTVAGIGVDPRNIAQRIMDVSC